MVYGGDFGFEDDTRISKGSPPRPPRKMNQTIPSAASDTPSPYRAFRLPIWWSSSNLSYVIFFLFACSCLFTSDAVSAEHINAYSESKYHSPNEYKNDPDKKCVNCNKIDREALKNITLQEIKQQILMRLGFTNGTPNASNRLPESLIPPMKMLSMNINRSSHTRHSDSTSTTGPALGPVSIQNDENKYDIDDGVKTHTVVAKAKEGESGT